MCSCIFSLKKKNSSHYTRGKCIQITYSIFCENLQICSCRIFPKVWQKYGVRVFYLLYESSLIHSQFLIFFFLSFNYALTSRFKPLCLCKQPAFSVFCWVFFFPICLVLLFRTRSSQCAPLPAGGTNWALNCTNYEDISPFTVWSLGKIWPLPMPQSTRWQDLPRGSSLSHQLS